jgi:haloacetate dehalogenase
MDEADDRAGNKIVAPVHVLWGAKGTVGQLWDVLATWRAKATSTLPGAVSIAAISFRKNVPRKP